MTDAHGRRRAIHEVLAEAREVDSAVLARTIVELVTTWAVKMPWDPAPRPYPDDTAAACAAMIRHLLTGPAR